MNDAWILEIPMRSGANGEAFARSPEQGAWLEARGYPPPSAKGQVPLNSEELNALIAALEPIGVPWAAFEAGAELDALGRAGRRDDARTLSETLRDLAPAWMEGRMARLSLLLHRCRDADAAEADLDSLPEGVLGAGERRSFRQAIAHLREDWVGYAREQETMFAEGGRQPADWEALGLARWAAGNREGALQAFDAGVYDHPGHRDLALRAVEVLYALGRRGEASARIDALAAVGPAHPQTLAWRGWMRRDADPVGAAADYEGALSVYPDLPVARVGRGLLRLAAGDREGARGDLSPFQRCGWADAAEAWRSFCATEEG